MAVDFCTLQCARENWLNLATVHFTHYLYEGLGGQSVALDSGMLTLASLYSYVSIQLRSRAKSYHHKQNPSLSNAEQGLFLLGNFTAPLQASALDLEDYPISALEFRDSESARVTNVLTQISRWRAYSEEYLEGVVNGQIEKHFSDTLGERAARISFRLNLLHCQLLCGCQGIGRRHFHIRFHASTFPVRLRH